MKDQTVEDQNELIETIQGLGWEVTASKLEEYQMMDGEVRGAEIELTVFNNYQDDEDGTNPFKIK